MGKKSLGSGGKIRVGRDTGNKQYFFLGLSLYVFGTHFVSGVGRFAEYIMGYPVIVGVLDIALRGESGNTLLIESF